MLSFPWKVFVLYIKIILSSVVFKNISATCDDPALKTKYKTMKLEKVIVNGKPLVIQ